MTERARGTSAIAENVREVLKADTLTELNAAYAEEIAAGMLRRWELRNASDEKNLDAILMGVADKRKIGYRDIFPEVAAKQGFAKGEINDQIIESGWSKTLALARRRFEELRQRHELERMKKAAPALPERAEEEVHEVEPLPDDEVTS